MQPQVEALSEASTKTKPHGEHGTAPNAIQKPYEPCDKHLDKLSGQQKPQQEEPCEMPGPSSVPWLHDTRLYTKAIVLPTVSACASKKLYQ